MILFKMFGSKHGKERQKLSASVGEDRAAWGGEGSFCGSSAFTQASITLYVLYLL